MVVIPTFYLDLHRKATGSSRKANAYSLFMQ